MVSTGVRDSGAKASVWQQVKQVLPRFGKARQNGKESSVRLDIHAAAVATETKPSLDSLSATPPQEMEGSPGGGAPQPGAAPSFGYCRGLERRFAIVKELARGGNGIVTLAVDRTTGKEYAVKSMLKVLDDPNLSDRKRAEHGDAIRREVDVLRRLRGCLNVAALEEVYEDDTRVHLVMEYCSGGELHHAVGQRHYTERTVASYLRATLRTLAQCHAQKILHRDVKPGNFILSSTDPRAPLKAIDFGLAVFYDDKALPRTDLGLEGTPWFMAPEVLSSQVTPAADIWSAGVMAAQLLTGRFPFDDRESPFNPSLTKVWKSILCDELRLGGSAWEGVSDDAKSFVALLLNKDPAKRPTAKDALRHPWLAGPGPEERGVGRSLGLAVVQRIQRYGSSSVFKRSVLEHIAEELLHAGPGCERVVPLGEDARPLIIDPKASPLEYLYERLSLAGKDRVDRAALADGLAELGYRLGPDEIERLLDQLDPGNTGVVAKSQFAASQIDWGALQRDQREHWLAAARHAFSEMDVDGDGVLSVEEMVASLRQKLPADEVDGAVRHALSEAARRDGSSHHGSANGSRHGPGASQHGGSASGGDSLRGGLNFQQFVRMLRNGSSDCLDLYDDRLGSSFGSPGSFERLSQLLEKSVRGSDLYRAGHLEPVPEADRE